jgi:hypothetical protein
MRTRQILAWSLMAALLLLADDMLAQGCASCYTTAAAGGRATIHALRNGILVLLVPPAVMFAGLMLVLCRWRVSSEACPHVPNRNAAVNLQNKA